MPAPARPNYLLLAVLLVLTQLALLPLRSRGEARGIAADPAQFPATVGEWQGWQAEPFQEETLAELHADACLHRLYSRPDGTSVDLTVIYGHEKSTFHSPGFCLLGGGWSIIAKGIVQASVGQPGDPPVRLNRFLLQKRENRAVVLYFYSQGRRTTTSWTLFQGRLFWDRLRGGTGAGALVRLGVPATGEGQAADRIALEFLAQAYPALLRSMSTGSPEEGKTDTDGSDVTSRGGGHQPGHRYR